MEIRFNQTLTLKQNKNISFKCEIREKSIRTTDSCHFTARAVRLESTLLSRDLDGRLESTLFSRNLFSMDIHTYERLKKTHTANGYLEIVKEWVLERSVDMNGRDKKGWTGLHRASSKSHVKIVEFLIRNGADVNRTNKYNMIALYIAILSDRLESAKIMIENGSNVNIRIGSNSPDSFQRGKSPLDLACYKGQLEICSLLLENGANTFFSYFAFERYVFVLF